VLATETLSHYLTSRLTEKTICRLRIQLSQLILGSPYPVLQKLGKSKLLANLTTDISTISQAFMLFPNICVSFAMVLGCMAYLAWLSWQMALILAGAIILGVGSYKLVSNLANSSLAKSREVYDNLSQDFRDLTEGIKELQLHKTRSEDFMERSLVNNAEANRRLTLSAQVSYIFADKLLFLLYYSMIGALLFAAPLQTLNQEALSGYVLVLLFMVGHLGALTRSVPTFVGTGIALKKIKALGDLLHTRTTKTPPTDLSDEWRSFESISLNNVTHVFYREKEQSHFTLGPLNLEFSPGELVFLIGGNGCGKSTLAMLLLGLYHPEKGEIKFNGITINDENRDLYMQNFSVVFSDFYLFSELFGIDSEQISDQVIHYLERLHLAHKVTFQNRQFSTINLSQGQRKRLALLIAYLDDRPFYVFDEWAADQDPEFKDIFYEELLPELKAKGKTVLAITHDDRYFHLADRCIKLEEGQIKME
jgi:putative ATP-binding cassette transporter